jgi:hypothetical protein
MIRVADDPWMRRRNGARRRLDGTVQSALCARSPRPQLAGAGNCLVAPKQWLHGWPTDEKGNGPYSPTCAPAGDRRKSALYKTGSTSRSDCFTSRLSPKRATTC